MVERKLKPKTRSGPNQGREKPVPEASRALYANQPLYRRRSVGRRNGERSQLLWTFVVGMAVGATALFQSTHPQGISQFTDSGPMALIDDHPTAAISTNRGPAQTIVKKNPTLQPLKLLKPAEN